MIARTCCSLVLCLALFSPLALGDAEDEAAIRNRVASVGLLLDLGLFEALETVFADEVLFDYTSLNGGEPARVRAVEQIATWARFMPGFDVTRHGISDIEVVQDGDAATANAAVTVDHFVDGMHWQIRGGYRFSLHRDDGAWRITALVFDYRDQSGEREAFGIAAARAASDPDPYLARP